MIKIILQTKQLRASSCGSQLEMTRWKCFVKLFNYLNVNIVKSFHLRFVNSSHECHSPLSTQITVALFTNCATLLPADNFAFVGVLFVVTGCLCHLQEYAFR